MAPGGLIGVIRGEKDLGTNQDAWALQRGNLVPIIEEFSEASSESDQEEKTFRLVPREFATALLKFEEGSMISSERFSEKEKEVLDAYVDKKYIKSACVAGETVYFGLDPDVRRYLLGALRGKL